MALSSSQRSRPLALAPRGMSSVDHAPRIDSRTAGREVNVSRVVSSFGARTEHLTGSRNPTVLLDQWLPVGTWAAIITVPCVLRNSDESYSFFDLGGIQCRLSASTGAPRSLSLDEAPVPGVEVDGYFQFVPLGPYPTRGTISLQMLANVRRWPSNPEVGSVSVHVMIAGTQSFVGEAGPVSATFVSLD